MREFDKIYIAKYESFLTKRQLAEDLNVTQEDIEKALNEIKSNGIYEVYKDITDDEWENLEKWENCYVKAMYYKKSKYMNNLVAKKLIKEFTISIGEILRDFPKYEYEKCNFDRDYMQEKNYENEEWKRIKDLNYEISNYGRIKNITTKKLKKLKHQPYGMQVLLWQNSKSYTITISRLVAEMFIRHLEPSERAIHINGNAKDNYYKNLKIVSK